eukprot:CAMPEP_0184283272 /NCGR_PEP_ID=MMETSP0977-20130417/65592_1 /TAXON_ID=483370 /ORGANISM="non described non described, Strain CCMP2097" /LENGTH=724 /DNA_ID=CAMNT_0026589283 /DNA_START=60 /DNA_END=2236 /DNA_ORIENTATION=-
MSISMRLPLTALALLLAPAAPQALSCSPLTSGVCAVELGTAGDFAILGKSGISTVPTSDITGDIGVSPIAATAMTGFALTLDSSGQFSTSSQVDANTMMRLGALALLLAPAAPQALPCSPLTGGVCAVDLGTAGDFAILGKSGISTVPTSSITGDIGVSPIAATAMTGFALVLDSSGQFSTSSQVDGECYAADYAAPTPEKMTKAIGDMEFAYTDAASRKTTDPSKNEFKGGEIGGETLTSGVYSWTTGVNIKTDVTLTGGPTDVFILKTTGVIFATANAKVLLVGGVQAKNVFWQAAGNVAIGANAHMEGIFLVKTDVVFITARRSTAACGEIGGETLTSGVYSWTTGVNIKTDVTLTGGPSDVFILKTTGVIFATAGVRVILAGGVMAKNVFWQAAGNVAIGANAHVEGIFLVKTDVVFITGASINGRLLAQTAVNLQKAVVKEPPMTAEEALVRAEETDAMIAAKGPPTPPCSPVTVGGICGVDLRTAGDFAILGKSGISTVPSSDIMGDIGVSPIAATAMTGFALVLDASGTFSKSVQVSGECYAADYAAPTPAKMTAAIGDMEFAYADAASRKTTDPSKNEFKGGEIGGETLTPGVYSWTTGVNIKTDVTLTGGPTDVFILKTTGVIFATANAKVLLVGGVQAKNVFWQAAGNVAIGANAHMEGIFLVKTDVVFITGASINGRLLAQTAVNLQKAIVKEPIDAVAVVAPKARRLRASAH